MSLLGWGSLALGAASIYQGYTASENQADAMAAGTAVTQEQLDFAKAQYEHVMDVYGPVEQNLSEYYSSLTPEQYKTQGLDAYDEQFKSARSAYETQMAQRGLTGSGIEAEGLLSQQMQGAQARANIAATSDQQWAQDQLSWLGVGLGQSNIAQQNIASSAANMANVYSSAGQTYGAQASAAGQGVGSLLGSVMQANAYAPGTVSLW